MGGDVNAEMVRRGATWVYRRYNRDPAPPAGMSCLRV